jgi:hypothetical protein
MNTIELELNLIAARGLDYFIGRVVFTGFGVLDAGCTGKLHSKTNPKPLARIFTGRNNFMVNPKD